MMTSPPFLQKGDTIAIAATARFVTHEQMKPIIEIIESWGIKVFIHEGLYEVCNQFGGDDEHRAKAFQDLINNTDIKAIICARGGYGTTRMIDLIDFSPMKTSPKWIAGFSDVTALHARLNHLKIQSLHSIMPILFENSLGEASVNSLKNTLFGNVTDFQVRVNSLNRLGVAKAELIGGNLSIIAHLMGSVDELDTAGKILFIEDLDEYLYHIDRMMVQLKRGGKLHQLAGLVVGHMSDMKDNQIPFGKNAYEIIAEYVAEYNFPVSFGFPVGHVFDNFTLICGANYQLEVNEYEVRLALK